MQRPRFSIKTLLWLTLCVAMFLGGMAAQYRLAGLQATEREKKLEATVSALDKQMRSLRKTTRTLDDKVFKLELEKVEKRRPVDLPCNLDRVSPLCLLPSHSLLNSTGMNLLLGTAIQASHRAEIRDSAAVAVHGAGGEWA